MGQVPALDRPADPLPPTVPGVRRIAVLRANGIGDYVVAEPAVTALRVAYPDGEITVLGAAHTRALVEHVRQRSRADDLAVQLHGGGRHSNPLLARLGARLTAGRPDGPRRDEDPRLRRRDRGLTRVPARRPCPTCLAPREPPSTGGRPDHSRTSA